MAEILELLTTALQYRASDILFAPNQAPTIRVNGGLKILPQAPTGDANEVRRWIYTLLNEQQRRDFEANRELDFAASLPLGRFRVNVFYQAHGVAAALRVISTTIPTPEQIGLSPAIMKLTQLPRGLVLVTGPTGSGKTSTLAAMVESINATQFKHILTIEDPIEFVYKNKSSLINQREVGMHTASFGKALKYALRQNPDIILIGEMRDMETMALAMAAAETGHLCFSTLHTQDAASTIDRIIDEFPHEQQGKVRAQLCTVLQAVVSQYLLPRKDGAGRVCAREVMLMNTGIASLIREEKINQLNGAIESGRDQGMVSMDQALSELVLKGQIDLNEAIAKSHEPASIKKLVKMGGGDDGSDDGLTNFDPLKHMQAAPTPA